MIINGDLKMMRKTLGIVLMVIGGIAAVVLLTYGGAILPHIVGPIIILIIGIILLALRRKENRHE
jgi:hypothetical protein